MRRWTLLSLALCVMGALSGCHHACTHGICDCEDDNYCASRAPWVQYGVPVAPVEEIAPPTKAMPNASKGL